MMPITQPASRPSRAALDGAGNRPFLPPKEAAQSGAAEDSWNVYQLIGGGWLLPTPWDDFDPQAELQRTLNASRQRDAFELLVLMD
jgi:hypothetical protein